ncbi:uncharacterized protein LOC129594353 [Paramacrobiotus metropolitanus]|uniref:uncharacterized protein LOC129594353 n=1 Tax=Paramacrobiotus metropolitanus TaxID=2943436 RepID=UPI0024457946|nr:uncharacterized protein LOC129594353 [Paramacrobiotus metropolitanus]
MKWTFIGLLLTQAFIILWKAAESTGNRTSKVFCSYRFGRQGSVTFACSDNEVCCDDECCPGSVPFYKLWYFWFTVIAISTFLSGITYICYQRCKRLRAEDELLASSHLPNSVPLRDLGITSNGPDFRQ